MPSTWSSLEGVSATRNAKSGWWDITYRTPEPLEAYEDGVPHLATYSFLAREARGRYLLVGDRKGIVGKFLARIGQKWFVRQPLVSTQAIAKHFILNRHETYAISALWSQVNGFGNSLTSATFYGEDFAGAALIRDLLPVLAVSRVQLRSLIADVDVLSVSAKGEISFFYQGPVSLNSVDACLSTLTANGFLSWDFPPAA